MDELTAFITTLRTGGDNSAGKASKQLGDRLEKLARSADELAGAGDEKAIEKWWRDAEKLLGDLEQWSDNGQLDMVVAVEAQDRIDDLESLIGE